MDMQEISDLKKSYNRRRYLARKNAGLCMGCGKETGDGKVYCPECRVRQNERARQNRAFYAEHGLCRRCGRNRVFGSEKRCPECRALDAAREARRARTDEVREKNNAYHRRRYQERSSLGICTQCGRRKAEAGKKRCGICAGRAAARNRERYVAAAIPKAERYRHGLCCTCSNSLDMDGMKICSRCYGHLSEVRKANPSWRQDNAGVYLKSPGGHCGTAAENAKRVFMAAPYAGAFRAGDV